MRIWTSAQFKKETKVLMTWVNNKGGRVKKIGVVTKLKEKMVNQRKFKENRF